MGTWDDSSSWMPNSALSQYLKALLILPLLPELPLKLPDVVIKNLILLEDACHATESSTSSAPIMQDYRRNLLSKYAFSACNLVAAAWRFYFAYSNTISLLHELTLLNAYYAWLRHGHFSRYVKASMSTLERISFEYTTYYFASFFDASWGGAGF